MTNQDLVELGFKEVPHFTVGNIVNYDLGRERMLSASDVGSPCEMLYIIQSTDSHVEDAVVIHNYDYDGYLTVEKVTGLISLITKEKTISNQSIH